MAYEHEKPMKRTHDGNTLVALSVEKEILKKREAIEDMSNLQTGADLELIYQAFTEIQNAHGKRPGKINPSCSGCTVDMKKLLRNWFKKYDDRAFEKPDLSKQTTKPLKPVKEKVDAPPTYGELRKRFNNEATLEEQQTINDGKAPKKEQLYEYFKIEA